VFGGAVRGSLHGVKYIDFLLPGIFVQSVAFRATQTAVGLAEDLERGVVDRFRSMPMARSAVLLGRTLADLVRNVLIIGLMIVVGYLVGFRFQAGVPQALACVAVVAAFGFALSWIFAFVALTVRGPEAAQSAGFVVIFPLVLLPTNPQTTSTFPSCTRGTIMDLTSSLLSSIRGLALRWVSSVIIGQSLESGSTITVSTPLRCKAAVKRRALVRSPRERRSSSVEGDIDGFASLENSSRLSVTPFIAETTTITPVPRS